MSIFLIKFIDKLNQCDIMNMNLRESEVDEMNDMLSLVATYVANLGFPIVMCVFMFRFFSNEFKTLTDAVTNLSEQLKIYTTKLDEKEKE